MHSDVSEDYGTDDSGVPIHVRYEGNRIEALFEPETHAVTITSGPLAGTKHKSTSRAAIEVVRSLNPDVHPNRNGWSFWTVTATGEPLQSLRRK
jgi:hypothetical protein